MFLRARGEDGVGTSSCHYLARTTIISFGGILVGRKAQ